MIRYEDALKIIQGLKPTLSQERLPLLDCLGRTLAADLTALVPSPPFTNASMDGFAVRHYEAEGGPLQIAGTTFARPHKADDLPHPAPGACVRIMTGAPVPPWADTVIPVEQTTIDGDGRVRFTSVAPLGANIRHRGEDLAEGSLALKKGKVLDAERLMIAAALGHRELIVVERPDLVFVSTGDELTEPGEPLAPGAVYNASKYFLMASAKALGFAAHHQTLADDEALAADVLGGVGRSGKPTILITTGAVSMGEADFIPRLGERLGFKTLFHQVAIRPGKPVYLAVKDHVVWLGLPGNPISTSVGWHIFARPLLAAVAGLPPTEKVLLTLKNEVRKPESLRCFFRAEVSGKNAWVAKRQGSAQFAASISNEAYVELPEGFSRIPAETRVEAILV